MDVGYEVEKIIEDIKNYFELAGKKKAVVGNSGGKDSAVVIGLLSKALGEENVIAVTMPCHSISEDRQDAIELADKFGVKCINVDLTEVFDILDQKIKEGNDEKSTSQDAKINIKPRLRMTTLYAIAQTEDALVVGTGNKCEIYVGYFTKFGDGACDYNPLAEYFVNEVYEIARYIGVIDKIINKSPSDGISGMSDEEKLKVTYAQIEEYIKTGKTDSEAQKIIERMHKISEHKRNMPVKYTRKV